MRKVTSLASSRSFLLVLPTSNKILKLIESGEDLTRDPRIKISTIHGVKGNERENVVVTTDLSASHFYEYKNIDSALQKIEEAKNLKLKHSKALLYNENWSKILEYI